MEVKRVRKIRAIYARPIFGGALTLGVMLAMASISMAHKVYLYAWLEGDTVYIESYFSSKKKVQGGLIEVFNLSGKKLLEGRTNERGEFAFKAPLQKTDLRIVVEASMGHKNEYILKANELWDTGGDETDQSKTEAGKSSTESSVSVEAQDIQRIVERALDSRLKPIIRELAQSRREKGPGVTEIIGGIGYIFGLMGLVMYFRSKKKR